MIECPKSIPPEDWEIRAPDGDGFVWLEVRDGESVTMYNLGTVAEVFDKLADWCSRFDPE